MTFIDAKILIHTAAQNGILQYVCPKKQHIFVYHKAGDADHPEGWYVDSIEETAQDLMDAPDAQKMLIDLLTAKGVDIPWFDWDDFHKTMTALSVLSGGSVARSEPIVTPLEAGGAK